MSSTHTPLRSIQTTTLTPTLRKTRKYLRILSFLVLFFGLWLLISLVNCSIDPELSTEASHPLGSVTHWVAAHLIYTLGVCSFSLCSIFLWSATLLWRYYIPKIAYSHLISYILLIVIAASYLEISLPHQRLFGAPLGGALGEFIGQTLLDIHWIAAQVLSMLALVTLFVLNEGYYKKYLQQKVVVNHRIEPKPVHSMNQENELRSHIFEAHDLHESSSEYGNDYDPHLSLQVPRKINEFSDQFYDDRDLLPSEPIISLEPRLTENALGADFYFSFDEESDIPSQLTPKIESSVRAGPRLTQVESEAVAHYNEHELDHNSGRESASSAPKNSTQHEGVDQVRHEDLHDLPMPRASRLRIIEATLQQMNLEFQLKLQHEGSISDTFTFYIFQNWTQKLQNFSYDFNQRVRRTLGKSEPPIRISQEVHEEQMTLYFSWPKRNARFPSAQEGIQKIRSLGNQSDLTLYLGEHTSAVGAYLPFHQVSSLLIAAGDHIETYMGLDLIVTNLVYQASPKELRLLIADPMSESSPFHELPHLYSPILEGEHIEEALSWFAIECRRRLSQFTRNRVESFQDYNQKHAETPLLRLVLIIPDLSRLSTKQLRQVTDCLKKLERAQYDIGLHLIMSTRTLDEESLPQVLIQEVKSKLILACQNAQESNRLQVEGAEWLLSHYDMLLEVSDGTHRIHGWQFSYASFTRVLRVFANNVPVEYISPECVFIQTIQHNTLS
jgi:DNA segregation ATPase FtsK/SpoIIIE-like protein